MPGLIDIAEADLAVTLEDPVFGFGQDITVTDPDGVTAGLVGFSGDIAQVIDPDTGTAISGRLAHVDLRISSLEAAGLGLPKEITKRTEKPWIIDFDDIQGNPYKFKVQQSNPDRTSGMVTCILEAYVE